MSMPLWAPLLTLASVLAGLAVATPTARATTDPSPSRNPGTIKTVTTPFVRAPAQLNRLRVDPKGRFIAYVDDDGLGLNVLDLKTQAIYRASDAQVGASFFWSPDGYRLFFRELVKRPDGTVHSIIKAYDCALSRSVAFDDLPFPTGILTFDPRDLRLHLMSPKGIRTKRIYFPDERLARWQAAQRKDDGKFLATQGGVLWVTQAGYAMRRLEDDGSDLESFDISADGSSIAWATKDGGVYASVEGKKPTFIGHGRDPNWHPDKAWLVYAGARMVGKVAVNYDVRVADARGGGGRFLTSTQWSDERWPRWHPKADQVMYTVAKTTDVFLLDFKP
jgi:hypothetical protein